MEFLQKMTNTVLSVHRCEGRSKLHAELLREIAWHRETLPLELMASWQQSGFDPHDESTRETLRLLKTGRTLSDVFLTLGLGGFVQSVRIIKDKQTDNIRVQIKCKIAINARCGEQA